MTEPVSQHMMRGPKQNLGMEKTNLSDTQLSHTSPLTFGKAPPFLGLPIGRVHEVEMVSRVLWLPLPQLKVWERQEASLQQEDGSLRAASEP